MLRNMSRLAYALLVVAIGTTANAQWVKSQGCYCAQPVVQTYYRTVPVTEYQQVRHKVRRPIVEIEYVDREFTEYRQVIEQKTAEVATVTYHNVTEYRTVQRRGGFWTSRYPGARLTPCQYDNRPGIIPEINRVSYAVRTAFSLPFQVRPQFVPTVTTQTVPITRRVAVHGTKKVVINVAKLVPYTATRKVAVRRVRYVEHEVVALRPVTVMRTIPSGSRFAYSWAPVRAAVSQTALRPSPDPQSRVGAKKNKVERTATSRDKFDKSSRSSDVKKKSQSTDTFGDQSSLDQTIRRSPANAVYTEEKRADTSAPRKRNIRFVAARSTISVGATGWKSRTPRPERLNGPKLIGPVLTVAKR